MSRDERVVQVIFSAIDDINQQLSKEKQIQKSVDTALLGPLSNLDSLGFVILIVAIGQKIEEGFRTTVNLTDGRAMSKKNSTFKTIGTLIDYISPFLKEKEKTAAGKRDD